MHGISGRHKYDLKRMFRLYFARVPGSWFVEHKVVIRLTASLIRLPGLVHLPAGLRVALIVKIPLSFKKVALSLHAKH